MRTFFGEALEDRRPFDEQTPGALLLTFYRRRVHERANLRDRNDLEPEEETYLKTLDDMLDGPIPESPSLIEIYEEKLLATKTGDETLDRWYDALDCDEVPDELWGPKGPPEGWIKGARGWKAPPGWQPPERREV